MYCNNILFIVVGMQYGAQCFQGLFLFKYEYKSLLCLWKLLLWPSKLSFSVSNQMKPKGGLDLESTDEIFYLIF